MTHVPLEQRSTTRLFLGFVVTILVPTAAAVALVGYCVVQFSYAFADIVSHFPFG